MEREFSPLKGAWPDPKKIKCKDCFFRDRAEVKLGERVLKVGITKDYCAKYLLPPDGNGKPTDVLFYGADCPYYRKDE